MSYCRFGSADIYLFECREGIACCLCWLGVRTFRSHATVDGFDFLLDRQRRLKRPWKKRWLQDQHRKTVSVSFNEIDPLFLTRTAALHHVQYHRASGDHVPLDVDAMLRNEIEEVGDRVAFFKVLSKRTQQRRIARQGIRLWLGRQQCKQWSNDVRRGATTAQQLRNTASHDQ
jgi:hypothetical protein